MWWACLLSACSNWAGAVNNSFGTLHVRPQWDGVVVVVVSTIESSDRSAIAGESKPITRGMRSDSFEDTYL